MDDQLLTGAAYASCIAIVSYYARLLTFGGSVAQFILGVVFLGFGGWQWTVPIVVFFLLSSLLSLAKSNAKTKAESYFQKSSRRDVLQVLANGGVAALLTLMWSLTRVDSLFAGYLGAVAAATADTWATEVGTLSSSRPILISSLKHVEAGRSGAVSLVGLLAGFVGSFVVFLSAMPWIGGENSGGYLMGTVCGGMAGSLADSILGATLQAQFRCDVCGLITERTVHCGRQTNITSGLKWLGNDAVNMLCTFVGAFVAYLLSF